MLTCAEAGYHWQQTDDDTGLPGNATFGGYLDSSDYDYLDGSGRTRDGSYGFYLLLDQMVYREGGPGTERRLTAWTALTLCPRRQGQPVPLHRFRRPLVSGPDPVAR